jgi:hypothetical protein
MILVAAAGVALLDANELAMDQTDAAIGKSVIPVGRFINSACCPRRVALAGVENSQSALKALLIDHAALTQPFEFPGLALDVRLEIDVAVQGRHPRLPPPHDLGEDFVMVFVLQNPDGMPIAPRRRRVHLDLSERNPQKTEDLAEPIQGHKQHGDDDERTRQRLADIGNEDREQKDCNRRVYDANAPDCPSRRDGGKGIDFERFVERIKGS